eukprot:TRINITY_DN4921_c0_g1_i1.p1 TRINITY_DN4921_c0_g1~~TRINITY_DN4921_c0_g1_i1.p1  ORF type:complete len:544 (-),score=125.89 TRINITY_DN4921_c0_g1_i1:96-1598(-)
MGRHKTCTTMNSRLGLLRLSLWAYALQMGVMETAADFDPSENDDIGEDDFRSQFGLDQIDDPGQKAEERKALKENEEIVKWVNKEYVEGKVDWYDRLNDMADLTDEEFVKEKTGLRMRRRFGRGLLLMADDDRDERSEKCFDQFRYSRARVPSSYNSVKKGYVSPIRNQKQCGSCVSFATMATVETCFKKITGVFGDYSEQELLDCGYGQNEAWMCDGAQLYSYAKWVVDNQRELTHEYDYPYLNTAPKFTCPRSNPFNQGARVSDYFYTQDGTEDMLKKLVYKHGAVQAAVNADHTFSNYGGGILDGCYNNAKESINHAITVVGYGSKGGTKYWLIKNSWGTGWGEKGFIRLKRGSNACGIGWHMTTVSCERVSGPTDRSPASTTTLAPCTDDWRRCPEYAKTNCKTYGKGCRKSCGLCKGMTPHKTNTCPDVWPEACKTHARDGRCTESSIKSNCCLSCGSIRPTCKDEWGDDCRSKRSFICPKAKWAKYCKKTCGGC